jgi:hypothetical protein
MKILTPVVVGLIFAGAAACCASVPLTEKIGTVPPDLFHAMSGNFTAARGYTNDVTLLVPAAMVNKMYATKRVKASAATMSPPATANAFTTPMNWTSTPLKPLVPLVDPAANRTVPSSSH